MAEESTMTTTKATTTSVDICLQNYKWFINSAQCTNTSLIQLSDVEQRLLTLIDKIPVFIDKANTFSEEAKLITKRWREASLMLSKHSQVLEFLEIPQLMETCVRNNCYDEALQLYSYVHKLERRYGSNIPLISNVCGDANECKELMINQLLKELYGNTQLAQCLKIINCLRKLEAFNETQLRIKFLTARDSWLQCLIKEIPTSNSLIYISKLTELYRVNLFDIITQYRAVFAGEDTTTPSIRLYIQVEDVNMKESSILPSWIQYKIESYLKQLESHLNDLIYNDYNYYPIDAIIDPCFYFGLSMSRIGSDFRPLLLPIFTNVIHKRFQYVMQKAVNKFNIQLENYAFRKSSPQPPQPLLPPQQKQQKQQQDNMMPPLKLLEFIPLANLCNDILTGFNEFRQLIPIGVMKKIKDELEKSFQQISTSIAQYYETERSSFLPEEREIFNRFCDLYVNELIMYIQKCLNECCPYNIITSILNISLLEFHKLKKTENEIVYINLNIQQIIKPIEYLLNDDQ